MNLENLKSIKQMLSFLNGSQVIAFIVADSKEERYRLAERMLQRFKYRQLKRCDKGVVIKFLMKVTGYSRQQLARIIHRHLVTNLSF